MFTVDTFRLIRKTFNRFFTLVMIVLIGVSFMMGLMSCTTIMKHSVDVYADEYRLQDFQLYSSYGFDDDDVKAIAAQDFSEYVFPSKMVDCFGKTGKKEGFVVRYREAYSQVNRYRLIEGRNPENDHEAVALSGDGLHVGDVVELYLEDEDISESLRYSKVTITGIAESPEFMAKFAGTSTLNNLDIDAVIYGNNTNFIKDYYTSVFLTLTGCSDVRSFTSAYDKLSDEKKSDVESFAISQQDKRKESLLKEYKEEIEKGEKELSEKKEEGLNKLEDAKKELDDAHIQLMFAEMTIETNETTLKAGKSELEKNERILNDSRAQVYDAIALIEKERGQSFDSVYQLMEATYQTYIMLESQIGNDTFVNESSKRKEELISLRDANEIRINEINDRIAEIDIILESGDDDELLEEKNSLSTEKELLVSQNEYINRTIETLDGVTQESNDQAIRDMLDRLDSEAGGSVKESYAQLKMLKEGKDKVDAGSVELESARKQITDGEKALVDAKHELAKGKNKYLDGLSEYEDGLYEFNTEIEKAENDIRKAYQDLEELPEAKWMILDRDSQYSAYMFRNNADQMGAIGISVPLLFYLVAALVCMTTMTRLIDEQRSQIGIYRALGFTKLQVIGKYCTYAFVATVSGSLAGVPIGMALFPTVVYETWRLMYIFPPRQMIIDPLILAVCVMAFAVLIVGVTFIVARRSLKEMPAALMRPKAPKNAKKVFLELIPSFWNRLSFTSKITARNLIRYKTRFFMTVIGVAGCTGLLVVGFGIRDSIGDVVNVQYGNILNYNYTVSLENDKYLDDTLASLKADYSNEKIVPFMSYSSKGYFDDKEETVIVQVFDQRESSDVLSLRSYSGGNDIRLNSNGVIVSAKYAKNNGIRKGDMITIESESGLKGTVKVAEIAEWYFQHYIFISDACYQSAFDESIHKNMIAVESEDRSALMSDLSGIEGIKSVTDFSGFIDQFNTMISALDVIIYVIILTAGSLAFVVLINLTQVNISERIREIATLKVLGFRNSEVNSYIFKEILLLTVIGGLIGLPLGYGEERMIMSIINMDMIMFGTRIKLISYVYSFAITFVFTYIVLFATRKSLREVEMIESLKSVE